MRATRLVVAIAMIVGLVATPASATHGGPHPAFRTEHAYFHCSEPTKLYQANWLAALAAASSYAHWNTTPPSGSVTEGHGCGGADWGGTTNPAYDPVFTGTFKGNLRDMTVRLHQFVTHGAGSPTPQTLRLYAEIDGKPLFPPGQLPEHGRTVAVTPVLVNSGVTELYEFSITNIGYAREVRDANGNVVDVQRGGAAKEDGTGTMEHELTLYVGLHGTAFAQDPTGHKAAMWVWDTTEVASGITFNPPLLAPAKVAADLP
jgi:hypothetical protein